MIAVKAVIQTRYISSVFIESPPFRLSLPDRREHVGVTRDLPRARPSVEDRQRVAGTLDRRPAVFWRHRDGETRPHPGPVADDLDLLDFAAALDVERFQRRQARGERRLAPHRRVSGRQKYDVV